MDESDGLMPPLGDVELEALKVLWEAGPSPVRRVADLLRDRGRAMKYTTAQTHLNRLKAKGYVEVEPGDAGPALVYRAVASREDLVRDRLRDLADRFCEGTPAPLVLSLVEGHRFTAEEVARFRALLDRNRPES